MGIQTPYNNAIVNGIAMVYSEDCEPYFRLLRGSSHLLSKVLTLNPCYKWIGPTYPTHKTRDVTHLGFVGSSPPSNMVYKNHQLRHKQT